MFLVVVHCSLMAASEHNESIVIKGGILISAMTGIDMRATKDLDATIISSPTTMRGFEKIAHDVAAYIFVLCSGLIKLA